MPKTNRTFLERHGWPILIGSGLLEAVWATALGASDGFTRLVPSLVFTVTVVISTVGLGLAMKSIPTGTAYAVWTGIGAVLTVTWALATGTEAFSVLKVLFLLGVIGCVVGLQIVNRHESAERSQQDAAAAAE
ncbi:DMT family transporter [Enemella sp. A6]|uniref:DMT family transporter n=1 Tax=Enemella sp. A6 TaxID=3440152 RepID=UPI003EBE40BD